MTLLLDMPSSETPGSPPTACAQFFVGGTSLRPVRTASALPIAPPSDSGGNLISGLTGSHLLRPAKLLASLSDHDQKEALQSSWRSKTFTSGLSTIRSASSSPDITTVSTGHLHRWLFHPLERHLASLRPDVQISCIRLFGSRICCLTAQNKDDGSRDP